VILLLGTIMSGVQYGVAAAGMVPLSGFLAGLAGLVAGVMVGRDAQGRAASAPNASALRRLFCIYLAVAVLMALVTLVPALRETAQHFSWKPQFPATTTHTGFAFPASAGAVLRPLSHPGVLIALAALGVLLFRHEERSRLPAVAQATWRSAGPASAGILTMVGLAALMEQAGMTQLLAQQTSELAGRTYPFFAPAIGVLGAFATGSNNNSNVMFAPLQKQVALSLELAPAIIVAAQTSGGSLGSLLAPAKIIVGCATVDLPGQEGQVLRKTLPWGLAITALLGLLTWLLVTFR
jgi:lactate permease